MISFMDTSEYTFEPYWNLLLRDLKRRYQRSSGPVEYYYSLNSVTARTSWRYESRWNKIVNY